MLALLGLFVLGACAGILGLRRPTTEQTFPHRSHVYAGVSCVDCHTSVAKDGDDSPVTFPADDTCTGCHTKPHDTRSCRGCHGSPWAEGGAVEARDHLRFSHARHVPVQDGDCVQCHRGVRQDDTVLRPTMSTCLGCHEHKAQFEPGKCDTCHKDLPSEGVLPASHIVHDEDWPQTHGVAAAASGDLCATCHTQSSCAGCHGVTTAALPATIRFDDVMSASIHRAGFRSRHADEANAAPGTCNACHAESSCRTCHEQEGVAATAVGSPSPHPLRWVGLSPDENEHGRAARRDPAACASCHGGAGEQLCVTCHAVGAVGGNPHPPGWSSNQPMSALPCRLCHQP
jgi:predicted CXXCH cytochrome family protein